MIGVKKGNQERLLSNVKEKRPTNIKVIKCDDCEAVYYGPSSRSINIRKVKTIFDLSKQQ